MDGWKTILSFWERFLAGAMLVSGKVLCIHIQFYILMPGSSKCVKVLPFHQKDLPKRRNFTSLEDPGRYICTGILCNTAVIAR